MSEKDFARSSYALAERAPAYLEDEPDSASDLGALPNEMPPPTDLSRLSPGALHSGTVETLIGQNEDLMARLKVNIRRCAALERQLVDQESAASDLRRINVSITAQIQVILEKEQSLRERTDAAERERDSLRIRARLAEAFRRRVERWVRPRFKTAIRAEAALFTREAELFATKARLARANERADELEASGARNQTLLVEAYETQLAEVRADADRLRSERVYLKERSDRLDETRRKLAELENEVVFGERQRLELERKLNEDVARLQEDMSGYRREAKKLASELAESKRAQEKLESKRISLSRQLARAEDQFESVRAVWEDAQKRADALAARNDALARVNQELARKLRESRQPEGTLSLALEDPNKAAANEATRGEGYEKIDSLLAEIESGFTRQQQETQPEATEVSRAHGLDFVEKRSSDASP